MTEMQSIADFKEYLVQERKMSINLLDGKRMHIWIQVAHMSSFERREHRSELSQLRRRIRDFEGAIRVIEEYLD